MIATANCPDCKRPTVPTQAAHEAIPWFDRCGYSVAGPDGRCADREGCAYRQRKTKENAFWGRRGRR